MKQQYPHSDITGKIIGAAIEVHRILGPGFLETVYEEALARELTRRGIPFERQIDVPIYYKGDVVGKHRLDLLVEGCIIVELKRVTDLAEVHFAVVLSYLNATNLDVALLLNFAKPRMECRRITRKGAP
ncbi:MAG TPA: GxxExxY protein [Symbiobacteriaceae bacterium]|nr:GxxExxY protein [Symbiobacteriaceae bacterium]